MSTFYLIRHGQKQNKSKDPELTTIGHEQAEQTGKFLLNYPITRIFASPMIRAQQTADHIAKVLNVEVVTDFRLRERMDFGEGRHKDRNEFFLDWRTSTWERDFKPKSGDSSFATGKRVEQVISELANGPHNHVALVSHGGAIADFLRNIFPSEKLKSLEFEFDEGEDFRIDECSVTVVEMKKGKWILASCHSTSHLL